MSCLCIQGNGPCQGRISSSASIGKLCLTFSNFVFVFVFVLLAKLRLKRRKTCEFKVNLGKCQLSSVQEQTFIRSSVVIIVMGKRVLYKTFSDLF